MRVTDRMGYEQVNRNIQKNRMEMSDLQNQAATQKRVTKPSDDPVASARVLTSRTDERAQTQFSKNINTAKSFLEFTDQSLAEMSEVFVRLKELAVQQANDAGASKETRGVVAEEVAQAFNQVVHIGNRKLGERYIFGGFQTTKAPFDLAGNYHGDDGDMKIHINKDAFVAMNLTGDKVFLGKGIGNDGLIRPRSETPTNADELFEFKNRENERQMRNQELNQESVRLRAPASEGRGGGSSFQSNVEVGDQGHAINILATVKAFEAALRVNDKEQIQEAIDELDKAISQVIHARAQTGARIQMLNHTLDSLSKSIIESKGLASQLEDADIFQVVSDMTKTDATLKATLETSGKVVQPSLLDFLR
jgi:flagellar hook-associated protein 3 FlgL